MFTKLAGAALLMLTPSAAALSGGKVEYEATLGSFRRWQQEFKVEGQQIYGHAAYYKEGSPEEQKAFAKWQSNLVRVRAHNKRAHLGLETYTVAMNRFADLSNDEYRRMILRPKSGVRMADASLPDASYTFHATGEALPDSVNWVDEGVITGVKNQGKYLFLSFFMSWPSLFF